MPRIEQLRHWLVVFTWRWRYRIVSFLSRVFGRLVPRQRAAIFFPLALVLAITSIVFAALATPGSSCAPASPMAVGAKYLPGNKVCRPYPAVGH